MCTVSPVTSLKSTNKGKLFLTDDFRFGKLLQWKVFVNEIYFKLFVLQRMGWKVDYSLVKHAVARN